MLLKATLNSIEPLPTSKPKEVTPKEEEKINNKTLDLAFSDLEQFSIGYSKNEKYF